MAILMILCKKDLTLTLSMLLLLTTAVRVSTLKICLLNCLYETHMIYIHTEIIVELLSQMNDQQVRTVEKGVEIPTTLYQSSPKGCIMHYFRLAKSHALLSWVETSVFTGHLTTAAVAYMVKVLQLYWHRSTKIPK